MITLELTEQEIQALAGLLDAGVKPLVCAPLKTLQRFWKS
jgi:hypothetical protein